MSRPARRAAIVTDSTAALSADVAAARGITVVPLQVVIGAKRLTEGVDVSPADIAAALRDFTPVSTSRPTPEAFSRAYAEAAAAGASEVVSIHLSSELSGTFESAQLAARGAAVPVHCVDSRQIGAAVGFAVLSAADARDDEADGVDIATVARKRAEGATALFYVDTLEFLRRGGRVGAAAALLGSALAVKPLLTVREGRIIPLEKVRTAARAINRLEEIAIEHALRASSGFDLAVQHLANEGHGHAVAARLRARLDVDDVPVSEVEAAIGAHVGPGMLGVTVSPRP